MPLRRAVLRYSSCRGALRRDCLLGVVPHQSAAHDPCPDVVSTADVLFVDHALCNWWSEVAAVLVYGCTYLLWNFTCWWIVRQAPYPLQAKVQRLGSVLAVLVYCGLVAFTLVLLQYSRLLRQGGHSTLVCLACMLPVAAVLWASVGLHPLKHRLAHFQGANLSSD